MKPWDNYQAYFHQRWTHLSHPDVRNLAWLLDSPILLNNCGEMYAQQLAEFPPIDTTTCEWLYGLEINPDPLTQYLAQYQHTRLGRYAESLLTFYFQWAGKLVAHNVQVQAKTITATSTIGEFDFLLNMAHGLEHWEFACKFYLLTPPADQLSDYVGPNLTDNLGDKFHKMIDSQLALGKHPEAEKYLIGPLSGAKILLKGWLFYPSLNTKALDAVGVIHCRGLWCRLAELSNQLRGDCFTLLPRFQWLAPAKVCLEKTVNFEQLQTDLIQHFLTSSSPVLVVQLTSDTNSWIETERWFVVPDDWSR